MVGVVVLCVAGACWRMRVGEEERSPLDRNRRTTLVKNRHLTCHLPGSDGLTQSGPVSGVWPGINPFKFAAFTH